MHASNATRCWVTSTTRASAGSSPANRSATSTSPTRSRSPPCSWIGSSPPAPERTFRRLPPHGRLERTHREPEPVHQEVKRVGHGYRCFDHHWPRVLLHAECCNWAQLIAPLTPSEPATPTQMSGARFVPIAAPLERKRRFPIPEKGPLIRLFTWWLDPEPFVECNARACSMNSSKVSSGVSGWVRTASWLRSQ